MSFLAPAVLSFISASLEGAGLAVLLPLLKGIADRDFSFLTQVPLIKIIISRIDPGDTHPQSVVFGILLASVFLSFVGSVIMRYLASISVSFHLKKVSDRLRRKIFSRYLIFGKLYFDRNNLGYLHNLLIGFTTQISMEFKNLQEAVNRFFSLVVYFGLMCFISLKFTLFTLAIFPVFNFGLKWLIKKIRKNSQSYAETYKKLNESIFNILSCIPLVKIYSRQEKEEEAFGKLSNNLRMVEYSLERKNFLLVPIQEIMILSAILVLVAIISFLLVKHNVDNVSSFLVFFYLLKKTSINFNFLNMIKGTFATTSGQINEIINVIDVDKDKFIIPEGKKEFSVLDSCIEVKNLTFSYTGITDVLSNLNLLIEKQKITALVGPSGAGKSTLVNLILRFYDCPPGTIFINGTDVREFSLNSLRRHMAMVSQDIMLFNDTLRNNIIYGLDREVGSGELAAIIDKSRLAECIARLPNGVETYIGDRGVKLSGGERQRVSIARALLKNAEILILDEATSSLDSHTEKLVQEAIYEVVKNRTSIVIAHRLTTIRNADKIAVLVEGRLIEEGRLEELLEKKGKFYEFWQEQKFY